MCIGKEVSHAISVSGCGAKWEQVPTSWTNVSREASHVNFIKKKKIVSPLQRPDVAQNRKEFPHHRRATGNGKETKPRE